MEDEKKEENKTSYGALIRRYRKMRKLSQTRLAEMTGLSMKTISRYEKDEREPRLSDLGNIAKALDVPPEALTDGLTISGIPVTQSVLEDLEESWNEDLEDAQIRQNAIEIASVFCEFDPDESHDWYVFSKCLQKMTAEGRRRILQYQDDIAEKFWDNEKTSFTFDKNYKGDPSDDDGGGE